MGSLLLAIAIGFSAGVTAYCVTAFWIKPIGRYRLAKNRIAADLTSFYGHLSETPLPGRQKGNGKALSRNLRKNGSVLSDLYNGELPYWYKLVLARRQEKPVEAAQHLQRLANTTNQNHARQRIEKVNASLRFGSAGNQPQNGTP